MSSEFPNVDEDTLELDEAPDRSVLPRITLPVRIASLFNYPNNVDQPLADHKKWLDLNVVPVMKSDRTLSVRLFGSASNDKAGVPFNLALAKRRAEAVKKFLLQQGVAERQFSVVQGTMETSRFSTDPRDRSVDVFVDSPVNTAFGIRVVAGTPRFPVGFPGKKFFFRIHDGNNSAEAFFSFDAPAGTLPPDGLDIDPTDGDFLVVNDFVSLRDFDGALATLTHPLVPVGQPDVLNVTLTKPGRFSTAFVIRLSGIDMKGGKATGRLSLTDGPLFSNVISGVRARRFAG
jgi:hypothetical protein